MRSRQRFVSLLVLAAVGASSALVMLQDGYAASVYAPQVGAEPSNRAEGPDQARASGTLSDERFGRPGPGDASNSRSEMAQTPRAGCEEPHPCGYQWPGFDDGPYDLAEVRQVEVQSFDGTVLQGWIGLPALPEDVTKAPVVLHSSPYLGACVVAAGGCVPGPDTEAFWNDDPGPLVTRTWGVAPVDLVRNGYATAFFSIRGTGGSGGCGDVFGPKEQQDQVALVNWLAGQDWSNGRVGMGGNSYPGTTPWEAAIHGPEGLKTIVTAGIVSDPYTGFHTPQGALAPVYAVEGPTIYAETDLTPHFGNGPGAAVEETPLIPGRLCPGRLAAELEAARGHFVDQRDASVWEPRRLIDRFPDVTAAVLLAQGLRDRTFHAFQESAVWASTPQAPKWQIAGQWGHGPPFAEEPALTPEWVRDNWETFVLDWLDYWLKGLGRPPALDQVDWQDSTGAWHTSIAWPPPEGRDEVLYLAGTSLSAGRGDGDRSFVATRSTLNDHRGARQMGVPDAALGAHCRNRATDAADPLGVAYVSEPVKERTVLAGNPFAYLTIGSNQPGGVFSIHLLRAPADLSCDDPSASFDWLATGAVDLRFHDARYVGRDFPVGEPAPVRVDLYDLAEVLEPGERLVVVVSGDEDFYGHAGQPRYSPRITVGAGTAVTASHLVVPVVSGTVGGEPPTLDYPHRPFVPEGEAEPGRQQRRPRKG